MCTRNRAETCGGRVCRICRRRRRRLEYSRGFNPLFNFWFFFHKLASEQLLVLVLSSGTSINVPRIVSGSCTYFNFMQPNLFLTFGPINKSWTDEDTQCWHFTVIYLHWFTQVLAIFTIDILYCSTCMYTTIRIPLRTWI